MNDEFLTQMRRDPDPEFRERLRERLRRHETHESLPGFRWKPLVALAATILAVTALFAFPSMRASAQAVLDLFRVRSFAAVPFDPSRVEKLRQQFGSDPMMGFGKHELLKDPGKPEVVATPEAASAIAGLTIETPRDLPDGLHLSKVTVERDAEMRITADASRLRALLDAVDIHDLQVPSGLDGRSFTVHKPPVVAIMYENDKHHAGVVQARNPQVELPAGVDLSQLAEIGMRVIGVDAAEARRLARTIDWHSTLVVPVPVNASSFRSVEVQGHPGLLVTTTGEGLPNHEGGQGPQGHGRGGTIVMWSEGDRVFAVMGDLRDVQLMQIAESLR